MHYKAIIGLLLFVISSVALGLWLQMFHLTSTFSDYDGVQYCEGGLDDKVPLQKVNSWSSLVYSVMGLVALFESPFTWLSWITGDPVLHGETVLIRIIFAMSMIVLGYGSFAFHALFMKSTALVDFTGIIAVICFFLSFSILRFCSSVSGNNGDCFLPLFFSLFIICMAIRLSLWYTLSFDATAPLFSLALMHILMELYMNVRVTLLYSGVKSTIQSRFLSLHLKNSPTLDEPSVFLLATVLPYGKREWRWLVAAFSLFSLAGLLWILDVFLGICAPESPFQLHAVWHVLTALASLCGYYYSLTLIATQIDPFSL